MVLCSHLLGAQYVMVYILMHQLYKAVDYLGTIREPCAYRSVDRLGASNMIVFTLVPTSVSIAVEHRARVLSVNVHGLSYGQTFCQFIIEICERNPMVLPFKWNLFFSEILRGPIYLLGFNKKSKVSRKNGPLFCF